VVDIVATIARVTQTTPTNAKGNEMTISQINEVCSEVYGCGLLAIGPVVALWLAERILEERGINVFKRISQHRNKYGLGTTFPEFGTPLFATL